MVAKSLFLTQEISSSSTQQPLFLVRATYQANKLHAGRGVQFNAWQHMGTWWVYGTGLGRPGRNVDVRDGCGCRWSRPRPGQQPSRSMLPCWPHLRREEASSDRRLTTPHNRLARALKITTSGMQVRTPGQWSLPLSRR